MTEPRDIQRVAPLIVVPTPGIRVRSSRVSIRITPTFALCNIPEKGLYTTPLNTSVPAKTHINWRLKKYRPSPYSVAAFAYEAENNTTRPMHNQRNVNHRNNLASIAHVWTWGSKKGIR